MHIREEICNFKNTTNWFHWGSPCGVRIISSFSIHTSVRNMQLQNGLWGSVCESPLQRKTTQNIESWGPHHTFSYFFYIVVKLCTLAVDFCAGLYFHYRLTFARVGVGETRILFGKKNLLSSKLCQSTFWTRLIMILNSNIFSHGTLPLATFTFFKFCITLSKKQISTAGEVGHWL